MFRSYSKPCEVKVHRLSSFLPYALTILGWEAPLTVDMAAGHMFLVKTGESLDPDTGSCVWRVQWAPMY